MSEHVSARYGVECTKCGAGPLDPCRTAGGRLTDTHRARIDAAAERRRVNAEQGVHTFGPRASRKR